MQWPSQNLDVRIADAVASHSSVGTLAKVDIAPGQRDLRAVRPFDALRTVHALAVGHCLDQA
jgi:hypothetical protein